MRPNIDVGALHHAFDYFGSYATGISKVNLSGFFRKPGRRQVTSRSKVDKHSEDDKDEKRQHRLDVKKILALFSPASYPFPASSAHRCGLCKGTRTNCLVNEIHRACCTCSRHNGCSHLFVAASHERKRTSEHACHSGSCVRTRV